MNNKTGILANSISLFSCMIAVIMGVFLFQMIIVLGITIAASNKILGNLIVCLFIVHAIVVFVKFVFSIVGYKTKFATPIGFLKLGWITILNIILCLLDVILSIFYLCFLPEVWFIVIAPSVLYVVSAVLYVLDYVKNKKAAKEQNAKQPDVEQTEEVVN